MHISLITRRRATAIGLTVAAALSGIHFGPVGATTSAKWSAQMALTVQVPALGEKADLTLCVPKYDKNSKKHIQWCGERKDLGGGANLATKLDVLASTRGGMLLSMKALPVGVESPKCGKLKGLVVEIRGFSGGGQVDAKHYSYASADTTDPAMTFDSVAFEAVDVSEGGDIPAEVRVCEIPRMPN